MTDPRILGTLMNIEQDLQRSAKALVKIATLLETVVNDQRTKGDSDAELVPRHPDRDG